MADYNINAITRRVVFTGSAGLGPYAFSFEILDQDDLAVYFNATSLTITTDYTVTINANGTGSVNIVTGGSVPSTPTASDQIVIVGARDIERVTDFVTAGDLLASSLNEQLDALTIFDQQVAEENKRGLRAPVYDPALVEDGGVVDMTLPAKADRAGRFLAFDGNGNPTATTNVGDFKGDWAASTVYRIGDLVKDTTDDSIYRVNTDHTSSGSLPLNTNTNAAYYDLFVDLSDINASEAAAAASATEAEEWASKTNGIVDGTDYSSKAYALGGTGVTNTSGKGAAKEWATTTGGTVDTSEYSSKEYAIGTTVAAGSSKDWATITGATVDGSEYSSKEYATGTTVASGSAKDWASQASGTVDGSEYSAKYYSGQASTSASNAATSETNASNSASAAASAQTAAEAARDAALAAYDDFDDRYLGDFASNPTTDNDGDPLAAGMLYFNTTDDTMKVYTGSGWVAAYVSGTGFLATTGGTMTGDIVLSSADITGTGDINTTGSLTVDGGTIKLDGNYPVGTGNVALGDAALDDGSLSGGSNTAIGSNVLTANTSGSDQTAIGRNSLRSNTSGARNTAVGETALYSNQTGNENTAVGKEALFYNTASYNTALGYQALQQNTTASYNTAVGYRAGYSNTTGQYNVALGGFSLYSNTAADYNVAIGYSAAYYTTGTYVTAVGANAAAFNTTGNIAALGWEAGYSNTTGTANTALGRYRPLYSNTTGSQNTAIGDQALYANTTANNNTAVGFNVLSTNSTGTENTALGGQALVYNTTASYNTAVGRSALFSNTTASQNTAVGYKAGNSNTTGAANTFIGDSAGRDTTGGSNTFVGRAAGSDITSGTKNTIVGRYSGNQDGLDIRTSSNNIVLSDGDGNVRALFNSSDGMIVGGGAGFTNNTNAILSAGGIYIGAYNGDKRITDGSQGGGTATLYIGNAAIQVSSDQRLKTNIVDTAMTAVDKINQVRVVDFNWDDPSDTSFNNRNARGTWTGVLAQELVSVFPFAVNAPRNEDDLTIDNDSDSKWQVDHANLVPVLMKAIQEQQATITALEARIAALES